MRARTAMLLLVGAGATNTASAFPDGAPWGSADPDAAENCATCHFSGDPVRNSNAIEIDGWPDEVAVGEVYELVVKFAAQDAAIAGMQVLIRSGDEEAGAFVEVPANTESSGAKARTIEPESFEDNAVTWTLEWQAPATADVPVSMCIAASAANDDASAFGDTIHFRCFRVSLAREIR